MREKAVGLYLYYTGSRLWLAGGRVASWYSAYSGKAGQYEPIPDGVYWINHSEVHQLTFLDDLRQKLLGDLYHLEPGSGWLAHQVGWGTYRIPIRQTSAQEQRTGRGNFFIHGGAQPGSAGCIDLTKQMPMFVGHLNQEVTWAKQDRLPLYVDNTLGP